MLKKIYLTAILGFFTSLSFAQTGTLKGKITDRITGKPVDYANVVIMKNGVQKGGTATGLDGSFTIKPIEPGTYTVKASFTGYTTFSLEGVIISANKITYLTGENAIKMTEGVLVDEIEDEFSTVQKWWEKIGLSSDPFNTNGLQTIKKEDYDEILVDNPAIKRAKDFRTGKNESFVLGTNYMILGKLGTG